ncbi:M6dom_TIGR03296, M6 family metalloprotease domain [Candidatus Nanopelagicaceae bacterium]
MVKKHIGASILVLSTVVSIAFPSNAISAVKAGATCPKLNKTQISGNQVFTCIAKNKKLVWSAGKAATPKQSSSASSSTSAKYEVSPSSLFQKIDECKIQTTNPASTSIGWPRPSDAVPSQGNIRAVTLLVDFEDLKHNDDALRVWKTQQIPAAENFYKKTSYGKMNLKVDLIEKIFHINKSVLSYNLDTAHGAPMKSNADVSGLIRDSVLIADPDIDFSKYDYVNVVNPNTTLIGFEGASGSNVVVDGKQISRATFGPIREYKDDPLKYNWLVHESGHLLGLMHPYNNGPEGRYGNGAYPAWDLMGHALTTTPEFLVWNKFLLGWVDERNLNCIASSKPTEAIQLISPISENGPGVKGIMVHISDTKVLVVENRRSSEFNEIFNNNGGIVVYTVDGTIPDSKGAVQYFYSTFSQNLDNLMLSALKPGEFVKVQNIQISVLSSVQAGDYVKVTLS